jgi:hypothetical protein
VLFAIQFQKHYLKFHTCQSYTRSRLGGVLVSVLATGPKGWGYQSALAATRDISGASRKWEFSLSIPVGLQDFFYMPYNLTTWDVRLYLPSEGKVCCGFLSPLKIHRLGRVRSHSRSRLSGPLRYYPGTEGRSSEMSVSPHHDNQSTVYLHRNTVQWFYCLSSSLYNYISRNLK